MLAGNATPLAGVAGDAEHIAVARQVLVTFSHIYLPGGRRSILSSGSVGNIDTTGPEKGYHMKQLLTLGMVAALFLAACAVKAYPTLSGPTGLIQAPTALTLAPGAIDIAGDYVWQKDTNSDVNRKDSWPIRLNYGVMNGLEVGATYAADQFEDKSFWDVNVKYAIPYNCYGVIPAIGVLYGESGTMPEGDKKLKATEVYLVGTDKLNMGACPISLTAGVNWTELK